MTRTMDVGLYFLVSIAITSIHIIGALIVSELRKIRRVLERRKP
jgi:hypothetical protein